MSLQPATTDKFEWQSDSDEALGRSLSFSLNSYATVTAMEIMFPVGDSYNFEINFFYYNGDGEPDLIVTVGFGSQFVRCFSQERWQELQKKKEENATC